MTAATASSEVFIHRRFCRRRGGTIARWYMLQSDYRQYPSYPQGWSIHLFLGGSSEAVSEPFSPCLSGAGIFGHFFLAPGSFSISRSAQRGTIYAQSMEETEMVPRGTGYIEGIARTFEARNYLSIWVALVMSASAEGLAAFGWPRHILSILAGGGQRDYIKQADARRADQGYCQG